MIVVYSKIKAGPTQSPPKWAFTLDIEHATWPIVELDSIDASHKD
jgi:hypothetical protein